MWDRSLGQEDPLENEMATHSSILAWEIPCMEDGGAWWATVHGVPRVRHDLATKQQHFLHDLATKQQHFLNPHLMDEKTIDEEAQVTCFRSCH